MTLESKIQELQRQLEIKKAYANVKISFGHAGKGIPEDIKEEITRKLTEIAVKLAEDQEINEKCETLTNEEITILKQIVHQILTPKDKKHTIPKKENLTVTKNDTIIPVTSEFLEHGEPLKGKIARLLLLDNIDVTMRKKIIPESEVKIMEIKEDQAFVQDKKANRFWVPVEDLDFNL